MNWLTEMNLVGLKLYKEYVLELLFGYFNGQKQFSFSYAPHEDLIFRIQVASMFLEIPGFTIHDYTI